MHLSRDRPRLRQSHLHRSRRHRRHARGPASSIDIVDGLSFDELQRLTGVPLDRPRRRRSNRFDTQGIGNHAEAFICDAIRTPFGRYGGALARVRADDLAAVPIKALMERNPTVDWSSRRRRHLRLRQPGGRRQPQRRRAWRCCSRACRVEIPGRDHQSPVRLEHRRDRHRRARDQERRGGAHDRRRRREHDARAVRDGQGRRRVLAQREDLRHDHRLALRQSADEGEVRRRLDARDRGERRRRVQLSRDDQDAFALRSQQRAAAAIAAGRLARGDRAGDRPAEEGRPGACSSRTSTRARRTLESLAKLKGVVKPDGTRHGGQRVGRQRWRVRACSLASAEAAHSASASRRARASSPPRPPAWRRASWASVPRPRRARCSPRRALQLGDMDVIELNEAFAAQALAVTRDLGLADDAAARQPERRRHRARAIRSARAARGSSPPPCTSCIAPAAATRCARCASASARASP